MSKDYGSWSLVQIKSELRKRNAKVTGKKAVLVQSVLIVSELIPIVFLKWLLFDVSVSELTFKEPPPPYEENHVADNVVERQEFHNSIDVLPCDALDLLANCKISNADDTQSEIEYAEIQDMGLWHSTPLTHRHKSKISLTWVLKENLESTKLQPKNEDKIKAIIGNDDRYRNNLKSNETERHRKCKSREVKERVVGRNEYYHNLRFKAACEDFLNQETFSDTSVGTEEYARRKHRHRHRRKKRSSNGKFGYDIRDLDSFLSEASIDRPGNIPVVIAYPTTLYQTHKESQQEFSLPLGTVVNAVFKNQQWLYAQTPHGDEGYVLYSACLPLGILPNRPSPQKKTPCWESSTDIYPRPCGNLTDNEKEQLRGRTRSECRYKPRDKKKLKNSCAEKDFDSLYLKTKSVTDLDRLGKENRATENLKTELEKLSKDNRTKDNVKTELERRNKENRTKDSIKTELEGLSKEYINKDTKDSLKSRRQTLLVVNSDYTGSVLNKTLTVEQGEVVILVQGAGETDVDSEWFYVRKRDGSNGFIPAVVAGHGYI